MSSPITAPRSTTQPGPTKQRAPMRAPSPTNACAAISRRRIDAGARGHGGRRMYAGIQRRIGMQQRRNARKGGVRIGGDQRRPPASPRPTFASRITAPARVSLSCATYLGLARNATERALRPATASRPNPRSTDGSPRSSQPKSHRQFAERHCHGGRRPCAFCPRIRAWRAASRGAASARGRSGGRLRRTRLQRLQHRRR